MRQGEHLLPSTRQREKRCCGQSIILSVCSFILVRAVRQRVSPCVTLALPSTEGFDIEIPVPPLRATRILDPSVSSSQTDPPSTHSSISRGPLSIVQVTEFCERLCFYGMSGSLTNFYTKVRPARPPTHCRAHSALSSFAVRPSLGSVPHYYPYSRARCKPAKGTCALWSYT